METGVTLFLEEKFQRGWKLRRVAGKARNMTENALSTIIVIFSVQLQQTEISDRNLFIFQHGVQGSK